MSYLYLFGSIAVFGLVGLLVLSSVEWETTGLFVTSIHMGVPSKNVKLSKKLIDGKEVMQAVIVPDKAYTKEQCKKPMCWYEDRYTDAQGTVQVTGKRDEKGVNMNICHSENALRTVRVRNEQECFMQKIHCKPHGTWETWQDSVSCPGQKSAAISKSISLVKKK